jgi:hypothetical protein
LRKEEKEMNLQEQISRMKSMMGMITESHKDCGIIYEPELKKDLESTNIFDMVVNDSNELIHTLNPKKQRLSPTKKVCSVQKDINMDYVNDMSDETYDKKDIHLYKHKGKLIVIDGHHRLCRDRMNDNDSMVYIWDKNDAELIDCIFYGIGDC